MGTCRLSFAFAALGLVACGSSDATDGGTTGGGTPTQGDMGIPVPADAPQCTLKDGNIVVKVTGDVDGAPFVIDWPSATGSISSTRPPAAVSTTFRLSPAGGYYAPKPIAGGDPGAKLGLKWKGTGDFVGSLPALGSASTGKPDGGTAVDVGNCEYVSRVWRIAPRSYVFEMTGLLATTGSDYCGGAPRAGRLVGCFIDDHGY